MKKENGWKKTWQGFAKRAAVLLVACAVVCSILPITMLAAAEAFDGKFWQTVATIQMDSFENLRNEGVLSDTATIGGKSYNVSFVWGTNAKRNGNSHAHNNGWYSLAQDALAIKPDGVGEYVLAHHGACNTETSWIWTSSDSGWKFSNLWDTGSVSAGDKIRISAQVYPDAEMMFKQTWSSSKNIFEPAGDSVTAGEMRMMTNSQTALTPVTGDQWNELKLEIDLTEDNISDNTVQIDSGAPAEGSVYATRWVIGLVKVEVYAEASGTYTIEDGKKWEQMSLVTMDDYESVEGASGGISWWGGKKSDNTGWLRAEAGNGKYTVFNSNTGYQRIHQGTGFKTMADETRITSNPVIPGASSITNVFLLNRAWSKTYGTWDAGMGKGAPDSRINISGIFDNTKVNVGDTVKITAWVYNALMHDATTASDVYKADTPGTLTMWLSDKARNETIATNGPSADYNLTKPVNSAETVTYNDMMEGTWREVSLTYTVTEENKDVTGVSFNSDKFGSETVEAFPLLLYLAAVKAEKLVDATDETVGRVAGSITAGGIGEIAEGDDVKVLAVAYSGDMFLGCDLVEYTADGKYNFAIENASNADNVVVYIWNMNNIKPRFMPIICENMTE